MPTDGIDAAVRVAAFQWLQEQVDRFDDVRPRSLLAQGFDYRGTRVPLLSPQGIFKPKILPSIPLSITTVPNSDYTDRFSDDGLLEYSYRGRDPGHRDNVGLREAMRTQTPLVYFQGLVAGRYLPVWPVFVVGDAPHALTFRVAVDEVRFARTAAQQAGQDQPLARDVEARRAYITSSVKVRLHQSGFRERVLHAYQEHCAFCSLRHRELLDAAHITPDTEEHGDPVVTNGLALCKIHHAAYDKFFVSVRPDYIIEVSPQILDEADGPMLRHGLQALHHRPIRLPSSRRDRPDPRRLEQRYVKFRSVA